MAPVPHNSNSDSADDAGGVQAPQAADARPESPRLVIRGESPDTTPEGGKALGAFTDFLNVTFRLPAWRDHASAFFYLLTEAIGSSFGTMEDTGRGLHGYLKSFKFERGGVRFAFGGQSETAFLSIPGDGCALVPNWERLRDVLRDKLDARITRWDGAVDDYQGTHSVDEAVTLYLAGAFNAGGRKPSCEQKGNWIEPGITGRTFYVGKRRNGKLLRVYEKGQQLGLAGSPWTRWEVELHNVDRVIPWKVLDEADQHIAGAYPALTWVHGEASRIPTLRRSDSITYKRIIFYARQAYGQLVATMLEREGDAESVVRRLKREGVPQRLELSERLGIRGDGEQ